MTACGRFGPRWHTSPKSHAEVTVRPFRWLQHVTLIFPCVFEHAICLFLVPFVFSSYTRSALSTVKTRCINSIRSVSFEEISVPEACAWLVLSRTCACAKVRCCVNDACPLSLSDPAVAVFLLLACARILRLVTDSHDHVFGSGPI